MRIDSISIKDFRCFKTYNVSFATKTTVLIGKNGTGKTNLINALKKGMSFMFAKTKDFKKSLSVSNFCNVRSFNLWDTRFDPIERGFSFPTVAKYEATFNTTPLKWEFRKMKDPGRLLTTRYRDALNFILKYYNKNVADSELPVLAFFSDSYPHIISNIGDKAGKIIKMDILPRDFGYYSWDEDTNCAELWQRRFIKVYNAVNDIIDDINETQDQIDFLKTRIGNKDEFDKHRITEWENKIEALDDKLIRLRSLSISDDYKTELQYINERILNFTAPVRSDLNFINSEFQIRRIAANRTDKKTFSIEFSFTDGRIMPFSILPQGYKRLLSMVFDIAYRGFILNGNKEPKGIVFIDEVELHLHPTLQQEVLERFMKTFPEIQFIVSTHSPLVISNLKADNNENKIIKLDNDGEKYTNELVENVYGIDYTTGLMDIMDAKFRSSTIDNLIDSYVILKLREKDEDAKRIWDEIFAIVGVNNKGIAEEINAKLIANR